MNKEVFIYGLRCPETGLIRYIGKSNQPERRAYLHVFAAQRGYHKHHTSRWLRQLQSKGLEPTLEILFRVPDSEDWRHHERRIIAEALHAGWPLTNQTKGGEGVAFLTVQDAERAKTARRNGMTDEVKSRMSKSMKRAWADPATRRRLVEKQKIAASRPERKQTLSKAARMRTPEGEQRRKDAVALYWSDPENRRRNGEATRARMLAGQASAMAKRRK